MAAKKKLSKKYLREVEKNQKKAGNKAIHNARGKGLGEATNTCSAVLIAGAQSKHSKAILTRSGAIGVPGGTLVGTAVMPWAGLTQAIVTRAFTNCAEAQAYIEVISRGGKPKEYRITAFTPAGDVNPPCENCSLWVYETFGEVVDH
jgi:hypothetical protein